MFMKSLVEWFGHASVDESTWTQGKYHLPEDRMVGRQCSWPKYKIINLELPAHITDTLNAALLMYYGLLRYVVMMI